ncbi:hypothetical protein TD95_002080 [Thielaviopsis punctulata]|uniref:COP9 signalosome complex subunit 2 n=1 Tax=Thielaviopsis punctulata TaxID=72032 RepID=A0A0F4ZIP8_9PEZI|nr:hypothetical protein TD95_002080 [Thielaviopsis punctulata]
MSDDDFMQESDEEQYDFEYEDDEDEEDGNVDIENKYYNAKQLKLTDKEEAITEFLDIPNHEPEKGEWGFKGLKQAIKTEWTLAKYSDAAEHYAELLTYVKSAVSRNYSEKSINNLLDYIDKSSGDAEASQSIGKFYFLTLDSFQSSHNERLWLKTTIKYVKLLMDRKEYPKAQATLKQLHRACQKEDGSDDTSKGTYAMEVYALDIQLNSTLKNNKQLKSLYERALKVRSAVPHPKIMGVIRECGGKMYMGEESWQLAQSDFFESFRNYDEAGCSDQRIQVLKYLLLTTMLTKSHINPFDSQETKPYKNDPRILPMTELVDAYQRDDIHKYQDVLEKNRDILEDQFIAENIDEVTRNMRIKSLHKIIAPYTSMHLSRIASTLKIAVGETMEMICFLINAGEIKGHIDQRAGVLYIGMDQEAEYLTVIQGLQAQVDRLMQVTTMELDMGRGGSDMVETSSSATVMDTAQQHQQQQSRLQFGVQTSRGSRFD